MHIWDLRLSSAKDLHIQTDSRSTSAPKSTRPSAVKADDKIVSCLSIVKGRTVLFLSPSLPLDFPGRLLFIFRATRDTCGGDVCDFTVLDKGTPFLSTALSSVSRAKRTLGRVGIHTLN